jgi:gluconate 2-dehydrogenase gamma chain
MQRREAVKIITTVFGASLVLPETVFARMSEAEAAGIKPKFFTGKERKMVAAFAECLIPETDTPGAISVGAPRWMEILIQDCYTAEDQGKIRTGLAKLEVDSKAQHGGSFAKLSPAKQAEILTALEKAERSGPGGYGWVRMMKDLCKTCYANTEKGATTTFNWLLAPGRWSGEEAYKMGDRVFL